MTDDTTPAPAHLRGDGRSFWNSTAYDNQTPQQHYLLCVICEQIMLQEKCRKVIEKRGPTLTSKTGVEKPRPELSIERQATRLIQSLLRQLDAQSALEHVNRGRVVPHSRGRYARNKQPLKES
jgi:hypothetical protein